MLINDSLNDYLRKVASATPAPGGGSAAAVAAGLGIALSSMVYNLTIGRDFYNEYDSDIKDEIENGLKICERLLDEYIKLIDDDKNAYEAVIKAIKMPRDTDENKAIRNETLQKAYINAMNVPLKLAQLCGEGFTPTLLIAQYGNQNAVSDAAVGALLLFAGLHSAMINVKVNAQYIKDENITKSAVKMCEDLIKRYEPVKEEILNISMKG
ncbi:cyclodeaminase/cyclohydrolase family protein [Thermoanaerobacterium sp. RBIITD]|uniref:cyclodeaminase/cyclohydrolase family protein n=1 Tax=Thermoanaerobacterium sp. RBIITD TaxID=1550240 RepID=UPI000BB8AD8A|nr:cyclodeaminase/cyclohydrolase family protein [Thermoanaerobacterium sp. RBIITD]SNX53196.1 Formiminotetrahydrofolate cyclodeaminase [Thermoanaerobacterium sp. RBIITD]